MRCDDAAGRVESYRQGGEREKKRERKRERERKKKKRMTAS